MIPQKGNQEVCGHNQLPLSYEIDQSVATAKKDTMEMKIGSSVNCATNGFMKLILKSNQHLSRFFHYSVVKFSCLYKRVLLFTIQ